ncbi:MAG: PilN domain-containing protein [Dehalococcoidia bacterium]
MGRSKNILVVAVSDEALLLSYLQRAYGKLRLRACHRTVLPEGARLPWLEDKRYGEQISSFIFRNRVNTESVLLSIPGREAVTAYLRVPAVPREDAEGMVRFEVEKHIPFPVDNAHYGYRMRDAGGGSAGLEVAVAAVEKSTLESYLVLLEEAGAKPTMVCLDITGQIEYWQNHKSAKEKAFLFLKVRSRTVDLGLVDGGLLKYFRSLPREAGDPLSSLVHSELRAAERLVDDYALGDLSFIALDGGDGEERQAAMEDLEGQLGLKVHFGQPITEKAAEREGFSPHETLTVMGLAEAAADGGGLIDLLPSRFRAAGGTRRHITSIRVLLVLAFIALGLLFSRANSEREQLRAIDQELSALKGEVLQVEELKSQVNAYLSKLSAFEELRLKEPGKLDLLRELTLITPPTAWVSVLLYENGKLDISGYAESASGLIPILEESEYFTNAQFIAPSVQRPWGEDFKIRTDVER